MKSCNTRKRFFVIVDKETKNKVDEFERQLKRIKGTDLLDSVNFSDLCSHVEISTKFKCPDFEKYDGKSCIEIMINC